METLKQTISRVLMELEAALAQLHKNKNEESKLYEKALSSLPGVTLLDIGERELGKIISGYINLDTQAMTFDFERNRVIICKDWQGVDEKLFIGTWETGFHLIVEIILNGTIFSEMDPKLKTILETLVEMGKKSGQRFIEAPS